MLLEYRSTPKNSAAILLTGLPHCFYGLYCFFALGCALILNFVCLHLLSRVRSVLLVLRPRLASLHVRENRSSSFVGVIVD